MFDWDDEELTNMKWGDAETGDHIVPFKVKSEQLNRKPEKSKTVKQAEQKITVNEIGSSWGHNVDEGIPQPDFCTSSWPDSSLFNAREADPDSNATELSKCIAEPARYDSTREKTSELGKGLDVFHSTDENKEQGDFDEYEWANIGSFDDLDLMFRNDVPTFGDGSLSCVDELWSSSKNESNSPSKSLPSILDSHDLGLDIRTEFEQQQDQHFLLTGGGNGPSSQSAANPYQQNEMVVFSKMSGTVEAGEFQDLYGQRTPSMNSPLMAINLQNESQGYGTSHHPHMPNQYMAASGFGNLTNPYSFVPVLSTVQCTGVKNQLMHPSYNPTSTISINMATDGSARPSTMTPQEKLEKLRRRQQIQAMLAIQRQQQQFRHQVPLADTSITHNCPQDNPLLCVDKTNLQGLTALPSFDPNSSLEQMDSGNLAAAGDISSEFSVLNRLQDVVAKLDMGIRNCIRDSLFRLASSATQRHQASDVAHSIKTSQDEQEVIPKEESRHRYDVMPDTETVTNPTDRTVAHLLFHRPFETSAKKHMEGQESPVSSKMGSKPKGNLLKCNIYKQKAREKGPTSSLALRNVPKSKSSSTVDEKVVQACHKRNL